MAAQVWAVGSEERQGPGRPLSTEGGHASGHDDSLMSQQARN